MAYRTTLTPILGRGADVPEDETTVEFMNMKFGELLGNTEDNRQQISILNGYEYEGKRFWLNNPYRWGGNLKLKGQLHCHTTNSDGVDTPTALVTAYKNAGYDFITISDHNYITPSPNVVGITWIGDTCEESYERHVNAFDITSKVNGLTNTQDIINFHNANNKMTMLNHLNWNYDISSSAKPAEISEIIKYYDFNFIEIFNAVTISQAEKQWDWALSCGKKVFGISSDDCHSIGGAYFNKGWVVVNSSANDKANILYNLEKGNFYASTGNDMAISLTNNVITATSPSSSNITCIGQNGRILKETLNATTSTYTIKGDEGYVRVVATRVSDGKKAWSNPIFIDTIGGDSNQPLNIAKLTSNENLIINGNFDFATRGANVINYFADRWNLGLGVSVGNVITNSIQKLPSGEIDGSSSFYRIAVDNGGSGYTDSSYCLLEQSIEKATRDFCGIGKKITLSFYARSNISGKKIAVNAIQAYGTGGSTSEQLIGKVFELSPFWKKYTFTFVTNDLMDKNLGLSNDDNIRIRFWYMWGNSFINRFNATVAETFIGAGSIDITQVKLEQGDTPTKFIPKKYRNELLDCKRYCYVLETPTFISSFSYTANEIYFWLPCQVPLRANPTGVFGVEGVDWTLFGGITGFSLSVANSNANGIFIIATKTNHGLQSAVLSILTKANRFEAEL